MLGRFVDDRPWAHLDIANVAWRGEGKPDGEKGATGFGVRTLAELAAALAAALAERR